MCFYKGISRMLVVISPAVFFSSIHENFTMSQHVGKTFPPLGVSEYCYSRQYQVANQQTLIADHLIDLRSMCFCALNCMNYKTKLVFDFLRVKPPCQQNQPMVSSDLVRALNFKERVDGFAQKPPKAQSVLKYGCLTQTAEQPLNLCSNQLLTLLLTCVMYTSIHSHAIRVLFPSGS